MGARFVENSGKGTSIPDYVPSTIGSGRQTVATAGTAVSLASSATIGSIIIVAEFDNTGVMCVGDSGVIADEATRIGIPLNPADATIIVIDDISKIWLDTTVNGDGVTYLSVK
jgi:hypothetical protein